MKKTGKFEKVSYEQWRSAIMAQTDSLTEAEITGLYEQITLPVRATRASAGHDFRSPIWVELAPGEDIVIPTGIRCRITDGWFLGLFPRSGLGFKYYLRLANTTGIIDADYYASDNEGHIMIKLRNESVDNTLTVNRGDAIAQGVFLPYGVTVDDTANAARNGGFGSTGA